MKKLINRISGNEMWVADSRYEEYVRAGHKPALVTAKPTKTIEEPAVKEPEKKPAKAPVKKFLKKK
jgi:hypothetical protein